MSTFIGIKGGGMEHSRSFDLLKSDHGLLHMFMSTVCLRRTKGMKFVNLKLPQKSDKVIRIKFEPHEDEKYEKLR